MIWFYLILAIFAIIVICFIVEEIRYEIKSPSTSYKWDFNGDYPAKVQKSFANRFIWPTLGGLALGTLVSVLATLMFGLIANGIASIWLSEPETTYSSLATIQDGSEASGSFFLGSGTVDSEPVYTYYVESNGQYRLYHVDADRAYVTYTDDTPQIVYHGHKSKNDFWYKDIGFGGTEYEFQVPRGSVKQVYNLDAK